MTQKALAETVSILRRLRPNVLIVGDAGAVALALEGIRPHLDLPVASWSPWSCRCWPDDPFRTLIVNGVDEMSLEQQERLMTFNEAAGRDVQVVSTAKAPLFDVVEKNAFLERLYYQLNVVFVDVRNPVASP